MLEHHDFTRPMAQRRMRIYQLCTAVMTVSAIFFVVGVGTGVLPNSPATAWIGSLFFVTPFYVALATAWWVEAPGENRTKLEKANEFQMIWCFIAAFGSEITWELPWLILDAFGKMDLTAEDRWGYFFYFYNQVDTRYLKSDPALYGMELTVVGLSLVLLFAGWRIRKAGNGDIAQRIRLQWLSFASMSAMLTIFVVYYMAEVRNGFANVRKGFWDIVIIFIYDNMAWFIAPVVLLPLVAQQIGYLYRRQALENAATQMTSVGSQPTAATRTR
ncbi:MAG: Emopamil-binding protein [Actinomycetota bacterium]